MLRNFNEVQKAKKMFYFLLKSFVNVKTISTFAGTKKERNTFF